MSKIINLFFLSFLLTGCASTPNPFSNDKTFAGISPPAIHRKDDVGRQKLKMSGLDEKQIAEAEAMPFVEYYMALQASSKATDSLTKQAIINDYVLKGITVVNISCARWFNSLAESQSRLAFTQNNQNVIQNLGTTLLGFGSANPVIVGTYGALFASLNGIQDNFSQSFLLAPNANKVKEHIFTALDQQASELRTPNDSPVRTSNTRKMAQQPTTHTEAYMALEKYAGICTQQTSKEIVNSALDQTTTQVQADRGNKVITASTPDPTLAKYSADVLALQKETTASIAELQAALKGAKTANDYQKLEKQLDEIAKKLSNPPITPPIVPPQTDVPPTNTVISPANTLPQPVEPAKPSTQ